MIPFDKRYGRMDTSVREGGGGGNAQLPYRYDPPQSIYLTEERRGGGACRPRPGSSKEGTRAGNNGDERNRMKRDGPVKFCGDEMIGEGRGWGHFYLAELVDGLPWLHPLDTQA